MQRIRLIHFTLQDQGTEGSLHRNMYVCMYALRTDRKQAQHYQTAPKKKSITGIREHPSSSCLFGAWLSISCAVFLTTSSATLTDIRLDSLSFSSLAVSPSAVHDSSATGKEGRDVGTRTSSGLCAKKHILRLHDSLSRQSLVRYLQHSSNTIRESYHHVGQGTYLVGCSQYSKVL